MRKNIVFASVLAAATVFALPSRAMAGVLEDTLDIEAIVSLGGPLGLAFADLKVPATSTPFTARVAGRISVPKYSPVALELSLVPPFGMGCNLIFNVFEMGRVRVHVLDPGIFWIWWKPVSASRLPRAFDLSLGAGVDVRIKGGWSVLIDWRGFFPDPVSSIPKYEGFVYPAYEEAAIGGQVWAGASYTW